MPLFCKTVQIINKSLWAATEKQHLRFLVLLGLSGPTQQWFGDLLSSDWRYTHRKFPPGGESQHGTLPTCSHLLLPASSLLQTGWETTLPLCQDNTLEIIFWHPFYLPTAFRFCKGNLALAVLILHWFWFVCLIDISKFPFP